MEQFVQSANVGLVDSLSFRSPTVATYVTSRKQISLSAAGGDVYGPTGGANLARFSLNTSGPFLDLSSLAIVGTLKNKSTYPLTILGPNFGTCIQSMRLIVGGVIVDSVDYSNRVESMLGFMQSESKLKMDYSEGLGYVSGDSATAFVSKPIAANASKKSVYRPKCLGSLFGQNMMPTALVSGGSTVLEVQFVNTGAECCDDTGTNSANWEISGLSVLVDCITCDSSFLSSLGAHLAGGGSMQMSWKAYTCSFYSVLATNMQIAHSRANSRLNTLFFSFYREGTEKTLKMCNNHYLPSQTTLKTRVQLGEARYPDILDNGREVHFHRLLHAMGAINNVSHAPCMTDTTFATNRFIGCQDFEILPSMDHSGVNSFNSQLTLNLEGIGPADELPTGVFIISSYDCMMELSAGGITTAV